MLSSAVINSPIKCLALRGSGSELLRMHVNTKYSFFVFGKQCVDGGNGEVSINPNDQCRLCNCSFKGKFIFLIHLKERSARVMF